MLEALYAAASNRKKKKLTQRQIDSLLLALGIFRPSAKKLASLGLTKKRIKRKKSSNDKS